MKFLFFCACTFSLTSINSLSQTQIQDRVYTEGNLVELFRNIETDEKLQFERLIAYHFHQIINEYRQTKGKKTLYWDDRLWLAARNHNLYMNAADELTHGESSKNSFYTGGAPTTRMKYTSYGLIQTDGGGENCLMFSLDEEEMTNELALSIAQDGFDQWRNSDGHNQNMLNSDYFAHGTAFSTNGAVYGTTAFCTTPAAFNKNEIEISWDEELAAKHPPLFKENGLEFKRYEWDVRLDEYAMFYILNQESKLNGLEEKDAAFTAAKMHLIYLLNENATGLEENKKAKSFYGTTSKKRYLKATKYLGIFGLLKYKVQEILFQFEITEDELKTKTAIIILEEKLKNGFPIPDRAEYWGGIIQLVKRGEKYIAYVDVMYLVR